jgi:hypothetical protein
MTRLMRAQAGAVITEYVIAAALLLMAAATIAGMWESVRFDNWLSSIRNTVFVQVTDESAVGRELADR